MHAVHRFVQCSEIDGKVQRLAGGQRVYTLFVHVTEFAGRVRRRLGDILRVGRLAQKQRTKNGRYHRQGKQPRPHPDSGCIEGVG